MPPKKAAARESDDSDDDLQVMAKFANVKINDADRQNIIESFGICVIRFTNEQVRNSIQSVITLLCKKMEELKSIRDQGSPEFIPIQSGGRCVCVCCFSPNISPRWG